MLREEKITRKKKVSSERSRSKEKKSKANKTKDLQMMIGGQSTQQFANDIGNHLKAVAPAWTATAWLLLIVLILVAVYLIVTIWQRIALASKLKHIAKEVKHVAQREGFQSPLAQREGLQSPLRRSRGCPY